MDLKYYAERYVRLPAPSPKGWKNRLIGRYLPEGAKVLDIGCANASFYEIWKVRNIHYEGIDYNDTLVEYCRSKWLNAQKCDLSAESLPFENDSFDFVYCSHVLEHLLSNEQIRFFQECSRILKPNGTLVLFTPTPYHWYFWDDPTHQRPSTHGSLSHLALDAGLSVLETKYSFIRFIPQKWQWLFRLPPLRWFLWEVYIIARKDS